MADDGLIAAYLRELAYSVRELPDADAIVAEAADHLYCAAESMAAEVAPYEAESEAVARFGSAALVARVCLSESKRGVAVPTVRTRQAGFAALLAPALLLGGQFLNITIPSDRGPGHGVGVFMLVAAFPSFGFGIWGLVKRHGGLGPLGRAGLVLALASPALSLAGGWGAAIVLAALLGTSVAAVAVQMLHAGVLPVMPVVMAGGGAAVGALSSLGALALAPLGLVSLASFGLAAVGFALLGWYMWREPAVDSSRFGPLAA